MLAVYKQTSDETDEEAGGEEDEVGHRLGKFSEEGGELGFEFRDPLGVGIGGRLGHVGHGDEILVRHLGIA